MLFYKTVFSLKATKIEQCTYKIYQVIVLIGLRIFIIMVIH